MQGVQKVMLQANHPLQVACQMWSAVSLSLHFVILASRFELSNLSDLHSANFCCCDGRLGQNSDGWEDQSNVLCSEEPTWWAQANPSLWHPTDGEEERWQEEAYSSSHLTCSQNFQGHCFRVLALRLDILTPSYNTSWFQESQCIQFFIAEVFKGKT